MATAFFADNRSKSEHISEEEEEDGTDLDDKKLVENYHYLLNHKFFCISNETSASSNNPFTNEKSSKFSETTNTQTKSYTDQILIKDIQEIHSIVQETKQITNNSKGNNRRKLAKTDSVHSGRSSSCDLKHSQDEISNSSTSDEIDFTTIKNNNLTKHKFRHLCSRLKSRLHFRNSLNEDGYKTFTTQWDFDWPNFEQLYENVAPCLINSLPGLDDFMLEQKRQLENQQSAASSDTEDIESNAFLDCKRGAKFRRNAICRRLDKTQYNEQLVKFIQQLMIEKLIRTWT
ncbi:unnamed protein product [Didymodactylos carnosus]|uniref:Uncharacterized protein n=1 Tax=Didymodactylos carnosus TaxID=1234261 RepID=A0A813UNR5_9BILA|nr:unnamed protein product [Didymodactylos carnosus]CAF3619495.1 unnamed protein product [Didymodactylos carnosus]